MIKKVTLCLILGNNIAFSVLLFGSVFYRLQSNLSSQIGGIMAILLIISSIYLPIHFLFVRNRFKQK